ncbi:helix-turn-helix domain-containing protein [Microbacteriaceae bacterium K1510]|nr:helix-turn-helix domain-containing protein [Microbacteriaceae bacterium K1510]
MESAAKAPALPESDNFTEAAAAALAAIGLRIKEIRTSRGLTLQALSDASGVSTSMLSLVERGRASPSIGSLVVIASALGVTMSDIVASEPTPEEKLVVRSSELKAIETAQHVIRRLMREDRARGVSVAVNEYAPNTGNADQPITHDGYEYGYLLEGELTVTVEGVSHVLKAGDLISYSSRRPHQIWNFSRLKARTLWFNLLRE